jgi:hypothetical protein
MAAAPDVTAGVWPHSLMFRPAATYRSAAAIKRSLLNGFKANIIWHRGKKGNLAIGCEVVVEFKRKTQ